jgi:serine/threonine-protein kinase
MLYGRGSDGSFVLRADADGDVWLPDWPVFNVTWDGAAAYAAWYAQRTGLPWRLPSADERERAGRGADGRFFPWGDEHDPSWCCMSDSRPGRAEPASIHQFPDDVSPFGVRGLAGNVRDWCLDQVGQDRRIDRGGFWLGSARESRLADQHDHVVGHRAAEIGFRLARAMAPSAPGA